MKEKRALSREPMDDDLLLRYSRHLMLPELDVAGQERLRNSRVLIIGLGGLGCPAATYLAAAGFGEMVLVDFDEVELSNLQRQIAHNAEAIGQNKAESVARFVQQLNPDCTTQVLPEKLGFAQLCEQVEGADVVLDCSDNFATRDQVNLACLLSKTPLISGAAIRLEGQLTVLDFRVEGSPCYQCLYGDAGDTDLTCSEAGVLAPLVGIIGSLQAMEAIKILVSIGPNSSGHGTLLTYDASAGTFRSFGYEKDPACPVCSHPNEARQRYLDQ